MDKKNESPSKYLKKEKIRTVSKQTIFYFNVYFVSHIFWLRNGIFDFQ